MSTKGAGVLEGLYSTNRQRYDLLTKLHCFVVMFSKMSLDRLVLGHELF